MYLMNLRRTTPTPPVIAPPSPIDLCVAHFHCLHSDLRDLSESEVLELAAIIHISGPNQSNDPDVMMAAQVLREQGLLALRDL